MINTSITCNLRNQKYLINIKKHIPQQTNCSITVDLFITTFIVLFQVKKLFKLNANFVRSNLYKNDVREEHYYSSYFSLYVTKLRKTLWNQFKSFRSFQKKHKQKPANAHRAYIQDNCIPKVITCDRSCCGIPDKVIAMERDSSRSNRVFCRGVADRKVRSVHTKLSNRAWLSFLCRTDRYDSGIIHFTNNEFESRNPLCNTSVGAYPIIIFSRLNFQNFPENYVIFSTAVSGRRRSYFYINFPVWSELDVVH